MIKEDLTNRRFGLLLVIREADRIGGQAAWLCKCDCERETIVRQAFLKNGNTRSCGCLRRKAKGGCISDPKLKIDEVRNMLKNGTSQQDIAKKFGVTRAAVNNLIRKKMIYDHSLRQIKEVCACVDALVRKRDSEEYMWEDAITELGLHPEMGVVVLAILFAKEGMQSGDVCRQVQSFLQ